MTTTEWLSGFQRWVRGYRRRQLRARAAVNNAVRDGRLARAGTCARCARPGRLEAHHPDYDKPLDVVWLCPPHHRHAHLKPESLVRLYEQETAWLARSPPSAQSAPMRSLMGSLS